MRKQQGGSFIYTQPEYLCAAVQEAGAEQPAALAQVTAGVSAPVLFAYIRWVLDQAERRGLKRLYFLARDGYMMYRYAQRFCAVYGLKIECRYLYCSRLSLRVPAYHLLGEEAFSMLFHGGYRITPRIVLERIGLSQGERQRVYLDAGLKDVQEDAVLPVVAYRAFAKQVWESKVFQDLLTQKSVDAYSNAIGYLRQEGLLEEELYGIVDTGWTGSIQRTLRQLLASAGHTAELVGFYFGMFEPPRDSADGVYLTWYFSAASSPAKISVFNNNVIECMCICPHPMTVGYQLTDGGYQPVWTPNKAADFTPDALRLQEDILMRFLERALQTPWEALCPDELERAVRRRLRRFLYRPSAWEAEAFAACSFCDDVAETYKNALVQQIDQSQAKQYVFFRRLYHKVLHSASEPPELFWPYGSIASSNIRARGWYRLNVKLWEMLRHVKQKRRKR